MYENEPKMADGLEKLDNVVIVPHIGSATCEARTKMSEIAAQNMLGAELPYVATPWFWSDQYEVKLQIAGLNIGYTDVYVRSGDTDGVQSNWYYDDKTLLAVDAMNDPRNYMIGKRLIEAGRSPDPALITDPATDMKALLKL